jgi:hypothetical protein
MLGRTGAGVNSRGWWISHAGRAVHRHLGFAVLKPDGRAAFIASGAQAPKADRSDMTALRPAVGRDRAHLDRIVELYLARAVRLPPVTLYSLSDAAEALRIRWSPPERHSGFQPSGKQE